MKYVLTVLFFLAPSFAQSDSIDFTSFEASLFDALRVAEAPCPPEVSEGMCYLHGYGNFFDFKESFRQAFPDLPAEQRWSLEDIEIDGETLEGFRARYSLAQGESVTLTFTSPRGLFLQR